MKKVLFGIVIIAVVGFVVYKLAFSGKKDSNTPEAPKDQPLAISKNSEAFNASFDKMLTAYFALKQGLTDYDTAKANASATELATAAEGLKVNEIKGDTTGAIKETVKMNAENIVSAAKGMVTDADLTKKKHVFQTISDALYDLTRMVKYDRTILFHQHCPMAFNDSEEGTWLSNSNEVVNPYLGTKHPKYKDKMLHCGDILDSLDFRK